MKFEFVVRRLGWLAAALALSLPAAAQPVKQERRTVAMHAGVLRELWLRSRQLSPEVVARMDSALLSDQTGNPFAPLARAFAAAEQQPFDLDLLTRLMVQVNALPEIVDPLVPEDGDAATPYRLHVTLHTPLTLAEERPFLFDLRLRDSEGKSVWQGKIEKATARGLAQFEHSIAVAMQDLPDARYRLTADVMLGDAAPRRFDPVPSADVWLQRGFAARATVWAEQADQASDTLDEVASAVVRGALIPVQRVYTGEAFDGVADVAADIGHAARVMEKLAAGEDLLAGASGFVSLLVPIEDKVRQAVQVRLRVPRAVAAAPGTAAPARPLVVFLDAPPTWDAAWSRPTFTRQRAPGFTARLLEDAGFDPEHRSVVAVVGADGEVTDPVAALAKCLDLLGKVAPIDARRVVLVAEREAAATALLLAKGRAERAPLCAVVAVSGGLLTRAEVGLLRHTRLLLVPGAGHGSFENLARVEQFAAEAEVRDRVARATTSAAWPWALPRSLAEIEAYCVEVTKQ